MAVELEKKLKKDLMIHSRTAQHFPYDWRKLRTDAVTIAENLNRRQSLGKDIFLSSFTEFDRANNAGVCLDLGIS
jgi:hypothetical protein